MNIKQINKLVARRNELTDEEKEALKEAIISNPVARGKAFRGAIKQGNMSLAMMLSMGQCS